MLKKDPCATLLILLGLAIKLALGALQSVGVASAVACGMVLLVLRWVAGGVDASCVGLSALWKGVPPILFPSVPA